MGAARSFGRFLGGVLFSMGLAFALVVTGLVAFTQEGNLREFFVSTFKPQIINQVQASMPQGTTMGQVTQGVLLSCLGKDAAEIPFPTSGGGQEGQMNVSIDCVRFRSLAADNSTAGITKVRDFLAGSVADSLFQGIYDKDYGCGFLECLSEGKATVALSRVGHDFFKASQDWLYGITAAGAALFLISAESWPERLKGLGIPMAIIGLTYFVFEYGEPWFQPFLPQATRDMMSQTGIGLDSVMSGLISPVRESFLIVFAAGMVLTVAGFGLAYYVKRTQKTPEERRREAEKSVKESGMDSASLTRIGGEARSSK